MTTSARLYFSSATPSSAPGNYSIIPTLVDPNDRETNYNVTIDDGTLFVVVTQPGVFQSIGLQTNGTILLNVSGATNATYTLDVSTDLISWTPLMTFTMTNGAVQLNDATSTNYSARYYLSGESLIPDRCALTKRTPAKAGVHHIMVFEDSEDKRVPCQPFLYRHQLLLNCLPTNY